MPISAKATKGLRKEMTKQEKRDLAKAFKEALGFLADSCTNDMGQRTMICLCIGRAHESGYITDKQSEAAYELINRRLNGHLTYKSWVLDHVDYASFTEDCERNQSRKLQDGRRRWLLSLIEEFSE